VKVVNVHKDKDVKVVRSQETTPMVIKHQERAKKIPPTDHKVIDHQETLRIVVQDQRVVKTKVKDASSNNADHQDHKAKKVKTKARDQTDHQEDQDHK
jgi:hypothetical protein